MTPADRRRAWSTLALAALADALLAPFIPQFFERTFATDAPAAAGVYVVVSRVAVFVALPIWAWVARTVPPLRVVSIGQLAAAAFGLAAATAPTVGAFLAFSFFAEFARTAYLLLYPALADGLPAERRAHVVVRVGALLHGAAIVSALASGALLEHLGGRWIIALQACVDLVQLAVLSGAARRARLVQERAPEPLPPGARASLPWLAVFAFLTTLSYAALRPLFTLFVARDVLARASLPVLGAVFVLPSVVALVLAPFLARLARDGNSVAVLASGAAALAVSAWAQFASPTLLALVAARALHGAASVVLEVAIDCRVLGSGGDGATVFARIHALQNVAIIVAPGAAVALSRGGNFAPLFAAASAVAAAAAMVAIAARLASPTAALVPPELEP